MVAEPVPVDDVRENRLAGWPRLALMLLCALAVVDFADRQVVVTTFPYLRAEFGVSDTQLGALVAAVSVVVALGTLPVALVVDRWSRVRAIAVMGTVWSGATAACAFAPGYVAVLMARIGIGVGQAGFGAAGAALLGARFPPDRRATVLGVFQMGTPLGTIAGAVVGSLVAASWGWRFAFLVVAVPGFVPALLALRLRDYPSVVQRSRARATAGVLLRARSAVGAMLGARCCSSSSPRCTRGCPRTWNVPMACRPPGPVSSDRSRCWPERPGRRRQALSPTGSPGGTCGYMLVPAITAVTTTATLGLAFAVVRPGAAQMVLVLLGAALAATANAPSLAVVLDIAPLSVGATATSMLALVQNLMGLAAGPVLTGVLADRWGLTAALAAVSGLGVAAGVALWCGSRSYPGDRVRVGLGLAAADRLSDTRRCNAVRSTPGSSTRAMIRYSAPGGSRRSISVPRPTGRSR